MNIQIFGKKSCNNTKKTERFFKERGIKYHFVNLLDKGMSPGEMSSVISAGHPLESLIDPDSKEYKKMNLQYMLFDIAEKLLEFPVLYRTPIVRNGKQATIGYDPETWNTWINKD